MPTEINEQAPVADQPQPSGQELDDRIAHILGEAHPYSTNLRAALLVVEKMLTDMHPYLVTLHSDSCEVSRPRWSGSHYQEGESLAHAICLAFLAAIDDDIGRWND